MRRMGLINLFCICDEKLRDELSSKKGFGFKKIEQTIERTVGDKKYTFTLFIKIHKTNELSWKWLLSAFDVNDKKYDKTQPAISSVLMIETMDKGEQRTYAVTFGYAHYYVHRYCDSEFGLNFASKVKFDRVNLTALTNPYSKRNKTINSYRDYDYLDYDGGEIFNKIKAHIEKNIGKGKRGTTFEMGTSVCVVVGDGLDNIIMLIDYIERVLSETAKNDIPVLQEIKDDKRIGELNNALNKAFGDRNNSVIVSDIETIGTDIELKGVDCEYTIQYQNKREKLYSVTIDDIYKFCENEKINYSDFLLKGKIKIRKEDNEVVPKRICDFIEYTDEKDKVIFTSGKWFQFNDDYIKYLDASVSEIETSEYKKLYDIANNVTEDGFIKRLKKECTDCKISHRKIVCKQGHKLEVTDVYIDETMYHVKIGHSSLKLSEAVDQSLEAIRLLKRKTEGTEEIETKQIKNKIKKIGLWLILDNGHGHIEDEKLCPDLSKLKMLILKSKLDEWKKEVRLAGYVPIVRVNYKEKQKK